MQKLFPGRSETSRGGDGSPRTRRFSDSSCVPITSCQSVFRVGAEERGDTGRSTARRQTVRSSRGLHLFIQPAGKKSALHHAHGKMSREVNPGTHTGFMGRDPRCILMFSGLGVAGRPSEREGSAYRDDGLGEQSSLTHANRAWPSMSWIAVSTRSSVRLHLFQRGYEICVPSTWYPKSSLLSDQLPSWLMFGRGRAGCWLRHRLHVLRFWVVP